MPRLIYPLSPFASCSLGRWGPSPQRKKTTLNTRLGANVGGTPSTATTSATAATPVRGPTGRFGPTPSPARSTVGSTTASPGAFATTTTTTNTRNRYQSSNFIARRGGNTKGKGRSAADAQVRPLS